MASMWTLPGKRQAFQGLIETLLSELQRGKTLKEIEEEREYQRGITAQQLGFQEQGLDLRGQQLAETRRGAMAGEDIARSGQELHRAIAELLEAGRTTRWGGVSGDVAAGIEGRAEESALDRAMRLQIEGMPQRGPAPINVPAGGFAGLPTGEMDPRLAELGTRRYLHETPSGTAQLPWERGPTPEQEASRGLAWRMHETPSGSARLQARKGRGIPGMPDITVASINSEIERLRSRIFGRYDNIMQEFEPGLPDGPEKQRAIAELEFWQMARGLMGGPPVEGAPGLGGGNMGGEGREAEPLSAYQELLAKPIPERRAGLGGLFGGTKAGAEDVLARGTAREERFYGGGGGMDISRVVGAGAGKAPSAPTPKQRKALALGRSKGMSEKEIRKQFREAYGFDLPKGW